MLCYLFQCVLQLLHKYYWLLLIVLFSDKEMIEKNDEKGKIENKPNQLVKKPNNDNK